MLILEHRYYSQSRPLPDLGVKSLAWLSSHQALADIARFIIAINKVRERSSRTGGLVSIVSYSRLSLMTSLTLLMEMMNLAMSASAWWELSQARFLTPRSGRGLLWP